jgi:hypothetical protein
MIRAPVTKNNKPRAARMCTITNTLYNEYGYGDDTLSFSPDAPPYPPLAPVQGRATPYTIAPLQCTVNVRTGTVRCVNNESYGELRPYFPRVTVSSPNMNYVVGSSIVGEPPDSPLNRILSRPPTGPWELVGAAVTHRGDTLPEAKTMMVYAQTVDSARDRYNYRVVDSNGVPLDIGYKVRWKGNGDRLDIPGYGHHYKLMLYQTYK